MPFIFVFTFFETDYNKNMTKKENKLLWPIVIWVTLIAWTLFTVLNEFLTNHWETILKKVTGIETTVNDTYIETIKTNAKIQDVEVIKEEIINQPIIQPVIIQRIVEKPKETFVDETDFNRCVDLFKRACILDWEERPEDCVMDAQYECEEDPNTRF